MTPIPAKKKVRRRIRFGLRTCLFGVTALAFLFAGINAVVTPWYLDRSKVEKLRSVNAQVFSEPRGQFFLRQFIGDRFSQRAIYLHLNDPQVDDEWLKNLQGMEHVEVLSVKSGNFTDVGLMELRKFPNLMDLNLVDTKVTEDGIDALRRSLPKLRLVQCRDSSDKVEDTVEPK